jgi:RNA polymerase sigma factor (sigma-70 family)
VTKKPSSRGETGTRLDASSSDESLVTAVIARHAEAIDLLYARYGRPAFALARRIVGDDGFAEDVVQEVFLSLWRDPAKFDRARGGFATWLLSVTHHKAADAVRREESLRRRRAQAAGHAVALVDGAAVEPSVHDAVWAQLKRDQIRTALKRLPDLQREALALAYFGGYTQREVAALTGAPLGTVKTRMLMGMRRLAEALGDSLRGEGQER